MQFRNADRWPLIIGFTVITEVYVHVYQFHIHVKRVKDLQILSPPTPPPPPPHTQNTNPWCMNSR